MLIGVPGETKDGESRVGMTPDGVAALVAAGHEIIVQSGAGARCGFDDEAYRDAGATLPNGAAAAWDCELVVKVKELQPTEYALARRGQVIFCYHHLAPEPPLLAALLSAGASCIAFETVTDEQGGLPLLAPMSQIAGRLAPLMGAAALEMKNGGSGVLLPGAPGVAPGRVVIIGAGHSGANAAHVAAGLGCDVTVFATSRMRLDALARAHPGRVRTALAETGTLEAAVADADLVIGAVLRAGSLSPKLINRALLRRMRPGSAFVDIGIDQGGIAETSRPTSHSAPYYVEERIVHYCVPNMPAACARSATLALAAATLPRVHALARLGLAGALAANAGLAAGLQLHEGHVTHRQLARDTGRPCVPFGNA